MPKYGGELNEAFIKLRSGAKSRASKPLINPLKPNSSTITFVSSISSNPLIRLKQEIY